MTVTSSLLQRWYPSGHPFFAASYQIRYNNDICDCMFCFKNSYKINITFGQSTQEICTNEGSTPPKAGDASACI